MARTFSRFTESYRWRHKGRRENTEGTRRQTEIKIEELREAIKWLKKWKSTRSRQDFYRIIKKMGEKGMHAFLEIYNEAWKDERTLILPIYKSGDSRDCNSYRGISLKIYEKIHEIESRSGEYIKRGPKRI